MFYGRIMLGGNMSKISNVLLMIEYFWREYIHYNIDISFKIDWSVFVYELV